MASTTQILAKRISAVYKQPTMGKGGRGKANPERSFASPKVSGTPGANNPSMGVRARTLSAGKGIVPPKAKTPVKTKQKNPKGRRSVKSTPVGYKNAKVPAKMVTGGAKGLTPKKRGGLGGARPNYGKLGQKPVAAVGGR